MFTVCMVKSNPSNKSNRPVNVVPIPKMILIVSLACMVPIIPKNTQHATLLQDGTISGGGGTANKSR